jgi:hypothetical protein
METPLGDLTVSALAARIGSDQISPGSGAAGAVTLALGAACGAKAVSITLKHSQDKQELRAALASFEQLGRLALQGADADAGTFAEFIQHKTAGTAAELEGTGHMMAHLIDAVFTVIDEVDSLVKPSMKGDLTAAKELASAAQAIQRGNEAEAKREEQSRRTDTYRS